LRIYRWDRTDYGGVAVFVVAGIREAVEVLVGSSQRMRQWMSY